MSDQIQPADENSSQVTTPYFPLYDQLFEQFGNSTNKLDQNEMMELLNTLRSMDKDGLEKVFVIIRIHSLRFSKSKLFDIPFQGEKLNERSDTHCDVRFDIRNFPANLQRMLRQFCILHQNV